MKGKFESKEGGTPQGKAWKKGQGKDAWNTSQKRSRIRGAEGNNFESWRDERNIEPNAEGH